MVEMTDAIGCGFHDRRVLIGRTTIEACVRSSEARSSLFLNGFRCACSAAAFRAGRASNPARFRLAKYGQVFALCCNIGSRRQASGTRSAFRAVVTQRAPNGKSLQSSCSVAFPTEVSAFGTGCCRSMANVWNSYLRVKLWNSVGYTIAIGHSVHRFAFL